MDGYPDELRVPSPIGYRIDTNQLRPRIDDLNGIMATNGTRDAREAIRGTGAARFDPHSPRRPWKATGQQTAIHNAVSRPLSQQQR